MPRGSQKATVLGMTCEETRRETSVGPGRTEGHREGLREKPVSGASERRGAAWLCVETARGGPGGEEVWAPDPRLRLGQGGGSGGGARADRSGVAFESRAFGRSI